MKINPSQFSDSYFWLFTFKVVAFEKLGSVVAAVNNLIDSAHTPHRGSPEFAGNFIRSDTRPGARVSYIALGAVTRGKPDTHGQH